MRLSALIWPATLFTVLLLASPAFALNSTAMTAHLQAGAAVLGTFQSSSSNLTNWMSTIDNNTHIQDMNIPGTHDSLTWMVNGISSPFTKTQDLSLFDQLNSGVRFIDLRIGMQNNQIMFFHGSILLDNTAQLEDVFWGLYYWLDANPTETILVSIKIDNGDNTVALQQQLYSLFTDTEVADYWIHNNTLSTMGACRHKLIPILRTSFDAANISNYTSQGPYLGQGWLDNTANITMPYLHDSANNTLQTVYIEDFYNPDTATLKDAVADKLTALKAHLQQSMSLSGNASAQTPGVWFIAFASGYNGVTSTPNEFATGETLPLPVTGVNSQLLPVLTANRGSYFGVLMFDFYGTDLRMGEATIGWEVPSSAFLRTSTPVSRLVAFVFAIVGILSCL